MGSIAARQAREVLRNVQQVVGLELLCAGQGLDFQMLASGRPGIGVAEAHRRLRERVDHLDADRDPGPDIAAALELVRSGALLDLVAPPAPRSDRASASAGPR